MFNGHWSHGKYGRCSTSLDIWWFLSGIAQITFPYFWFHDIHSPNQKCSFSLKSSLRNKITLLEGLGVWKEITQGKSMTRRCIQDKAVCRKVCRKCRQQCWLVFGGVGANAWDRVKEGEELPSKNSLMVKAMVEKAKSSSARENIETAVLAQDEFMRLSMKTRETQQRGKQLLNRITRRLTRADDRSNL